MKRVIIRSRAELDTALERIDELSGAIEDSDCDRELEELSDAIKIYQDAIEVMTGAASKAADMPEQPVNGISGAE